MTENNNNTQHFALCWLALARHGEFLCSLNLSIEDVLLVICVRLPLSSEGAQTPMCPGDNGMRQFLIYLI